MRQLDVAKKISKRTRIRTDAVQKVLSALGDVMADSLETGGRIRLSIGVFECRMRQPKPAYNFQLKKKIVLPAANTIIYHPAAKVLQVLREKDMQLEFEFTNA